jgi:hypothetical protein
MWNCRGPAVAGPFCGSDFLNFAFCTLIFELKRQYGQKGGKGDGSTSSPS